ncbi:MAG: hypothetical protein HGA78_05740 [Nitrospirales bacterium]|nr:hypothetical protein [Nitrospirales bacterium]
MVFPLPRITIIATGDEVLAVGRPFEEGKVFASNLVTIAAWCSWYGMESKTVVVRDSEKEISEAVLKWLPLSDCIITSGGAWDGDRDLVIKILDGMGWEKVYHRVKLGPGKAVGFGVMKSKPVFCLPGGPPSNQMAFLQLALPGLLALSGQKGFGLPVQKAVLGEILTGQEDWTQFVFGRLSAEGGRLCFHSLKGESRLRMMAGAEGIVCIPEGTICLEKGEMVRVQLVNSAYGGDETTPCDG